MFSTLFHKTDVSSMQSILLSLMLRWSENIWVEMSNYILSRLPVSALSKVFSVGLLTVIQWIQLPVFALLCHVYIWRKSCLVNWTLFGKNCEWVCWNPGTWVPKIGPITQGPIIRTEYIGTLIGSPSLIYGRGFTMAIISNNIRDMFMRSIHV